MNRRRRRSYKFTEKRHSKMAIASSVLAVISLVCYLVFVYLSYKAGGNLSTYYGSFGVLAMLVAMVALGMSIPTIREEDSFMLFPRIALVTSLLTTLIWLGTYVGGFVRG